MSDKPVNLRTLISAEELSALNASSRVLIVDCRFELSDPEKGRREFAAAHIPGAHYASLDDDLSDLSKPDLGRHPLPYAEDFASVLARWNWHPDIPVVAYDDAGGALAAARLWWLLRLAGYHNVAVLDGGFGAWRAEGLPVTQTTDTNAEISSDQLPPVIRFDEKQLVRYDELQRQLQAHSIALLDARGTPRYRGEVEPIDCVAGHVPGALNRPFPDNLQADGRFKSAASLCSEFTAVIGEVEPDRVVHMCGSGVSACHNLLAMEHAGLTGSRLFAPSWSGWISDSTRPTAQGDE